MYFRFQNKIAYEKTLIFTKDIFNLTGKLPDYEKNGVIKQLRAMGTSVLQDIAEHYSSKGPDDSFHSLDRSIKTVAKIAAMIDLCHNLGYLSSPNHHSWTVYCEDLAKHLEEIRKSPPKK
ncbi:hypothetical protein A2634_01000 [Candidatus Amesbacteria bacterium RIFCSPHIGHO2_01_FULL_48_32]|uniref:Four helix bundle protein n=1 Tax=Candidatus Amesbacteria bacterium RIFCSPLOWO2_01_FULL_48_25 TaxID=1797259 RepID=A0A1F4ZB75_9BACT|nr:MAG: hypothetical protein A2634_01000 [Candidatus Amesbacteria bacterium RIFCSPHIGHO2_01_FULL_48_32]OGD03620.1 MAG: hypothetical protein A2989_02980 [Candidatus Amesbacteria bacterium RIFCSPLOWO2_01_FULL_48_25]HJZ06034.1 four helix bundle protein [Patescibacteria group bacterium]